MDRFWDALEKSTLITGTAMLILVLAVCYMGIQGIEVPDLVEYITVALLGLFLGGRVQKAGALHAKERRAWEARVRAEASEAIRAEHKRMSDVGGGD